MERIIIYNAQKDHYHADACVVWCFDHRFSGLLDVFLNHQGIKNYDLVKVAGGSKGIASGTVGEEEFILGQIYKSILLHGSRKVILMVHANCGAYGKSFSHNEAEGEFLKTELEMAEENLGRFLGVRDLKVGVEKYIADFDGLLQV